MKAIWLVILIVFIWVFELTTNSFFKNTVWIFLASELLKSTTSLYYHTCKYVEKDCVFSWVNAK